MPDHSFNKEIFPDIESKPPLMQLEATIHWSLIGDVGGAFSRQHYLVNAGLGVSMS